MHRLHLAVTATIATLALSACGQGSQQPSSEMASETTAPAEPSAPAAPSAESATAQLAATQGNTAHGALTLSQSPEGVHITGTVQGLAPNGQFGFHIHEKGDCSAPDASSAGAHFNPDDQPHGDPSGEAHHAGDMLNLQADAEGTAQVDTIVRGVALHPGAGHDIVGKAIVVHERADDYTSQPSGNSGNRIACGVIAVGSGPTG